MHHGKQKGNIDKISVATEGFLEENMPLRRVTTKKPVRAHFLKLG